LRESSASQLYQKGGGRATLWGGNMWENGNFTRVSDRKPEPFREVLVFVDGTWGKGFWYSFSDQLPEVWRVDGKEYFHSTNKISHWIDLPVSPFFCANCMGKKRGETIWTYQNTTVCIRCGRDCEKDGEE